MVTFIGASVLFILLEIYFLALILLIVYVGAITILLTLGAHARELQYLFCLCVCVSVCLCVFPILAPRAIRRTNSSISDCDTGMKYKKGFFFKTLRFEVMA